MRPEFNCDVILYPGFLKAIRRLVTDVTFMSMVLGASAVLSRTYGTLVFMSKYMQTQFGLSDTTAPLLFGKSREGKGG